MRPRDHRALLALGAAILAAPCASLAFDPEGHVVIEAAAYRSLVEGGDAGPPRPEVLRDLINDGALMAPICFGRGPSLPRECRTVETENPLLQWPQPMTDGPDRNYSRQFDEPGQCVHFMGRLADERPPLLKGRHVPRALATTAIVRCSNMLDDILRQVVIVGGVGTRKSGYGLYELMHAVTDSFSYAHAERKPGTHQLDFLRVWAPIGTLAKGRLGDYFADSPLQHDADDPRDSAYVRNFAEVSGLPCKELTALPYTVPLACLSEEGDLARQALVELLVVVHDLRRAQLAAAPGVATLPEQAEAWRRFKSRWFSAVNPCLGEECQAKQPAELVQASSLLMGGGATFNPSRSYQDLTAHLRLTEWSQQASPFVLGLSVEGGYRRGFESRTNSGVIGAGFVLELPFDRRSAVGFSPLAWRYAFGPKGGLELFTQAIHYEFHAAENISVSVLGPVELDWRRVGLDWSFGVVVGYTPSRRHVAGGRLIGPPAEAAPRHDDQWAPEPLWFGRLKGRESGWFLFIDATPIPQTSTRNDLVLGGLWALGAELAWDRDPWGGRPPTDYGASLEVGLRSTSPASSYLTATGAIEVRWNFSRVLGLSIVPVRIEGGPKVRGIMVGDRAPGVQGRSGDQYFLTAGTRLGVALSAGMVDVLVQAPTLAWRASRPFDTGEILSLRVALRPGGRRRTGAASLRDRTGVRASRRLRPSPPRRRCRCES